MTTKSKYDADLVIAGGGIAGLALAALLGNAGLRVDLIEPFPPRPFAQTPVSARTVALMESSLNILRGTCVWERVAPISCPLKTMRIIDDSAAKEKVIKAEFHAGDIGLDQFGFNIPNASLRAALHEIAAKIPSITLRAPQSLSSYALENDVVNVELENGDAIKTPLLIGADGANSKIRAIAGIECDTKDYPQSVIVCLISHTRDHNETSTEFHRPSGPFALVPLPGKRSAVVWVEKTERADELLALRKDDFLAALQERSNDILGTLTLETNPESKKLRALKAKSLIAPRVALMAEAAHVMSPVAAQGLNLSLRDVAALAETIMDAARLGLDIGSAAVLEKYRRRRQGDINARVFGVDKMNGVISTDFSFLKRARRGGLQAVNAVAPLKKLAMRQGLAPETDLGRLAKGETL